MTRLTPGSQPHPPAAHASAQPVQTDRILLALSRLEQRLATMGRAAAALRPRLDRLEAAELQRSRGLSDRPAAKFRSQNGEDHLLWALLGDMEPGFFIEAGAFDGLMYSVSYVFECVGWKGLLVEPIAARAQECRRNRAWSAVEQCALSHAGAPEEALFTLMNNGEMLSYLRLTDAHRQRIARETEVKPETVRVPVRTLDSLLEGRTQRVDFCVFDVEGGEADLLAGFDVARWKPRAMLIEDSSMGKDQTVANHLARLGYRRVATADANDLYLHETDKEMFERLARLG